MVLSTRVLDIFFRRIQPDGLLRELLGKYHLDRRQRYENDFLSMAELMLSGYSYDEQKYIYSYCQQFYPEDTDDTFLPPFYLLREYGNTVFESGELLPVCRYGEVLNWRETYLLLGQDIFTTAWLAEHQAGKVRNIKFSWPVTVPVHHPIIEKITENIAENHMHLYAGACTFALTWACLMNHPEVVLSSEDVLEQLLQMQSSRNLSAGQWKQGKKMLYAAYIRGLLFDRLHGGADVIAARLRRFHDSYSTDEHMCKKVCRYVENMRLVYGIRFTQPGDDEDVCLDYAFSHELVNESEEHSRLLAGERRFLFDCFRACFSGAFHEDEQWFFYIYLLLKSQFRSEFIQVNRQVGFHNFSLYDKRKYVLWQEFPEYWYEDYRQALNATISEQKISSLEGRLSPQNSAMRNVNNIYSIDRAKLFYDAKTTAERWSIRRWQTGWHMRNNAKEQNYFFVLHFPKRKDDIPKSGNVLPTCRHEKYRTVLRENAIEIAKALSNCDYLCERIRGIDACSSEIGCRPEVFASVFRFLRDFPIDYYRKTVGSQLRPRLSATYHVGEDFLDIADGLRAMDEALNFLCLRRGDRFGHALALGIDPELHYKKKHHQLILPKQDHLDDLVWLCFRSVELNAEMPQALKSRLLNKAQALFDEVYGQVLKARAVTLEDYYNSMLLRGDSPMCYRAGDFAPCAVLDPFDTFAVNQNTELQDKLRHCRTLGKTTYINFCYHYSYTVKRAGMELVKVDISPEYVAFMKVMQSAMQRVVNDRGISIECNPSSNVLIGTFADYHNHPILNFNNKGLHLPQKAVQMHVSINSDDPGVFDTSLSFEYALLARAISDITDDDGNRIHSDREVEDYLRSLVRMGQEQCFPGVK